MARVAGSYQSVTRGVSQQVPQDRRPGQHWEQVNMISDPVRGVARRHGSLMLDEVAFANHGASAYAATLSDIQSFKELTFYVGGVEHSLVYRSAAKVASSLAPLAWCFDKDASTFRPYVRPVTDTALDTIESGGVSAIVNVGRFLFIAGKTTVPAYSTVNAWADTDNSRKTSIWVRGGTYSRTFTVKCRMADASTKTFSYQTLSSSYPGVLDTSSIPYDAVDYQKQVNDLTNDYNTAVTQWLGTAAADIQPESIAENLRLAAAGVGLTGTRIGSHLVFEAAQNIVEVEVSDGGDNTFIRGVAAEVAGPELLTNIHYAGKIVKVRPKKTSEEDAYYLEAIPKVNGATGWVEVSWRETAGVVYTPTTVFAMATVKSGNFYIAGSPSALGTLIGETVPGFEPNSCGDAVTSPVPSFFGQRIDYLGLFQDRLIVGSGAVLLFSRPGDYLNWFRASVLTIEDSDPIEMFAVGAEDDTITCSTTYDRNLVLFGQRKQYSITGRAPLTPLNQSISIMSAHEDAVDAFPINSGNLVFFGKHRNAFASMHQIQIGIVADSPEAFEVSQQLDTYLLGIPTEVKALTAPNMVALRTTGLTNGFYLYSYLDTAAGAERLFDAWYRWEWNTKLGNLAGISAYDGDFLAFTVRTGKDKDAVQKVWIVCDQFRTDATLSDEPYLDSQRSSVEAHAPSANTWLHIDSDAALLADSAMVFPTAHQYGLLGAPANLMDDFIAMYPSAPTESVMGVQFDSFVTPTNPYMRDRNDKAILSGRLTLGSVLVTLADSGGFVAEVEARGTVYEALRYTGRIAGAATSLLGTQPIVSQSVQFLVAREIRECKYTLRALKWLPLTITAIEWKGQNFNNARRG